MPTFNIAPAHKPTKKQLEIALKDMSCAMHRDEFRITAFLKEQGA